MPKGEGISSLLFSSLLFSRCKKLQAHTCKLVCLGAILAVTLASCERNELDMDTPRGNPSGTPHVSTSRSMRPVILGNRKNNPFSLANMTIALDTLKTILAQSNQQELKAQRLDGIAIEATDLYVRFLPNDSAHLLQLIKDTTLIVYDFPLDYEIIQDGDYYRDSTVTNGFTWYYSVVKPGYQPPAGFQYEVIEELFIPENSDYYSHESMELTAKSAKSAPKGRATLSDIALKALYTVAFTLTGNQAELQLDSPPAADGQGAMDLREAIGSMAASSPKGVDITKLSGNSYPTGTIQIQTPNGAVGTKGVVVRMRRWFNSAEARTNAQGYYRSTMAFNKISIGNKVGYYIKFDGRNGNVNWMLRDPLTYSLGDHSHLGLSTTIPATDDSWRRCVLSNAIYDYCDIARADGMALPPNEMDVDNVDASWNNLLFPELSKRDLAHKLKLYHSSGLNNYNTTVAHTWHGLIFASLYCRMIYEKGTSLAETTWSRVYNQFKDEWEEDLIDCSCARIEGKGSSVSEQAVLWDAWGKFRRAEMVFKHLPVTLTNNTYLIPYVDALRALRKSGCPPSVLEVAMTRPTIDLFKTYLLSQYPNSVSILNSIPSSPQKLANEYSMITFNILRSKSGHKQSDAIHKIARTIGCINPDIVFLQEIYGDRNFNNLKELTGMDGVLHETYYDYLFVIKYGIGVLWSKRLGTPSIKYVELDLDPEKRGFSIVEFPNFVFISTHWCRDHSSNRMLLSNKMLEIASSITNKAIFLGGDFNSNPNDAEIKNLTNSGFIILNDLNNLQGSSDVDLVFELNKSQDIYTIVSRGSKFPLESWRTTGSFPYVTSDHSPYHVVLKRN